jgi:D-alanyl-D-alanine dipeptidase
MNKYLPSEFVYIAHHLDNIQEIIPYAAKDNFLGVKVDGYLAHKAILSRAATEALFVAEQLAMQAGFGLKIFDAYRPRQAVEHFLRWLEIPNNEQIQQRFYPHLSKAELFAKGYLASQSRHCSGSTIDLSLYDLNSGQELDMGTEFDFFGEASWTSYGNLSTQQFANRQCLNRIMLAANFQPFVLEWWHFTLRDEPFPTQTFNFLIR